MPTYQYRCTECSHAFEQFQSFTEDALTACPECGGRLRKVFNAVGVVFKGSGFYRNDSRASGGNGQGSAGTESSGSESGSAEGSSSGSDETTTTSSTASTSSTGQSNGSTSTAPATAGR